jgi:hypothetical protein
VQAALAALQPGAQLAMGSLAHAALLVAQQRAQLAEPAQAQAAADALLDRLCALGEAPSVPEPGLKGPQVGARPWACLGS